METKIKTFIKKHYPTADITINGIGEEDIHLEWNKIPKFNPKFMYGKLFKTFKNFEYIVVEGEWDTWVYTKTSLKYGEYYK